MAQITLNLPDDDFKKLKEVAARTGGLDKYFQDALGLAQLVDEETRQKDNIIAIADKNGKVLRTVRTSKKQSS